jgi:hypothetical protein
MIPFAEWLPDQPSYNNPGATDVKNVLPITSNSYGPFAALKDVSNALPERPLGAAAFKTNAGGTYTFSGTSDNLYILSGQTWNEISKTTDVYATAEDFWQFTNYGDRAITVNGHTDAPQTFLMGTDTAWSDLGGSPPKARFIGVINNFVMLGNLNDATDGVKTNRVHWAAIDDPTDWPTIASSDAAQKQSDRQDLPTGGAVMGVVGAIGGADGAIICEDSIYRVVYEGPPSVFSFKEIERGRGTKSPRSIVNVGPFVMYLGQDGFYMFDGARSVPIGNQKVDKHFFSDVDSASLADVQGSADPINKIVFWAYPGQDSMNGIPNRIIFYNWKLERWGTADIDCDLIFRDLSPSLTLENLDAYGTLETLGISFDSRAWIGQSVIISAITTDHKLARFTGPNLEAMICTTEFGGMEVFQRQNERLYVDGVRPYVDGGSPTVTLKHRSTPQESLTSIGPRTVDGDGLAHFSQSCRYARACVVVPAGESWNHAQGVDIVALPDGDF